MFTLQHFHSPVDDQNIDKITTSYSDAMELVGKVVDTAAWNSPHFDHYFPPEARSKVAIVFQKIYGGHPDGSAALTQVVIENNDQLDKKDPRRRPKCDSQSVSMYALNKPQEAKHEKFQGFYDIARDYVSSVSHQGLL
ncbi:MAG: hypothetical protein LQ346_005391 [Caloplaca aetnensis]|nr:MAG: hypothetical protein LQ346_005391 [Caloplaca aetnensis]